MADGPWPLTLPAWVDEAVAARAPHYGDDDARMALAIALAGANLDRGDGGPFGAAVFDGDNHTLVAAGVNLVFAATTAVAHAEMVALTRAQQRTGLQSLGERPGLMLVTSAEPCAMCLGALPWSGIRRVVCGARDADIRAAGFDEGAKPPGWVEALETRGIAVTRDVRRAEAAAVLHAYATGGGRMY